MQLIETHTTGIPQFTEPSLSNISLLQITKLAISTLVYGAALRAIAPYSLNSNKKVVCFMGAEFLITLSLHAFPIHRLEMRYILKIEPNTIILNGNELTNTEREEIYNWATENKNAIQNRVYELENQDRTASRICKIALFAIALLPTGYLLKKSISTLSSNQLTSNFIAQKYIVYALIFKSMLPFLFANVEDTILQNRPALTLTNLSLNNGNLSPATLENRAAYAQQAIREIINEKPASNRTYSSQIQPESPTSRFIRAIGQLAVANILLYSYFQNKIIDLQVPKFDKPKTWKHSIRGIPIGMIWSSFFDKSIGQIAEVAFPNYVW